MTKKSSRIVAVIMLIIAIIFFVVALNNPQASFPWSNIITYILYGIYVIIMIGKFPLEQYHYIYSLWDICYYNDNTVYCSI